MSDFSREMENMLILENGEKVMKDGLATKGPSFLVDQLYLIHRKSRKDE